jgi:hypothetical protein
MKTGLYPNDQVIEVFGEQVKWPGLGPDGKFTNGSFKDPLIKPSFIPAETLNLLLDNMQMVIEAAGLEPNNIEPDQLLKALKELAGSGWAGGGGENNRTDWERFIDEFIIQSAVGAPFNPTYADGPAHGKGHVAFSRGVVADNGKVILVPAYRANIGVYDPVANTYVDGPAHGKGAGAFAGGVLAPNGKVILVPNNSANIGVYDPVANTYVDGPAHGKGKGNGNEGVFQGGVLAPNGKVILVPWSVANIGVYDPVANTYVDGPAHGKIKGDSFGIYSNGVLVPNGKVIFIPWYSGNIGVYDPATNTYVDGPAHGKGNNVFTSGVLDRKSVV